MGIESSHRKCFFNKAICEKLGNSADDGMHEKEITILRSSDGVNDVANGDHLIVSSESENLIAINSDEKINDCASKTVIPIGLSEKIDHELKIDENQNGEWDTVCRICLSYSKSTSSDSLAMSSSNGLVQLGCSCKGEMGLVHVNCAQIWFEMKGNRKCEICGDEAENIVGLVHGVVIGDNNQVINVVTNETTPALNLCGTLVKVIFGCFFLLPV